MPPFQHASSRVVRSGTRCKPSLCVLQAPYVVLCVNYIKTGSAAVLVYCTGVLLILVFRPGVSPVDLKAWQQDVTLIMLLGIAPALGIGALLAWAHMRYTQSVAIKAFK